MATEVTVEVAAIEAGVGAISLKIIEGARIKMVNKGEQGTLTCQLVNLVSAPCTSNSPRQNNVGFYGKR